MKLSILLAFSLVFSTTNTLGQHHATTTPDSKVTAEIILRQMFDEPALKDKEVQMLVVDFPPGIVGGAHRHPCQTFGYLLQGELESTFEGERHLYKKGDSFYELPNGLHSQTRNPSATETAKLLVFFIVDKGKETSIKGNE